MKLTSGKYYSIHEINDSNIDIHQITVRDDGFVEHHVDRIIIKERYPSEK